MKEFNIGDIWIDKVGNIVKIVDYSVGHWPWCAEVMKKIDSELTNNETYSNNGIYSSDLTPTKYDLLKKITREENPEYFL